MRWIFSNFIYSRFAYCFGWFFKWTRRSADYSSAQSNNTDTSVSIKVRIVKTTLFLVIHTLRLMLLVWFNLNRIFGNKWFFAILSIFLFSCIISKLLDFQFHIENSISGNIVIVVQVSVWWLNSTSIWISFRFIFYK